MPHYHKIMMKTALVLEMFSYLKKIPMPNAKPREENNVSFHFITR